MRFLLAALVLLYSNSCFTQIQVQNKDLKVRDSNILFRDLMNHIEVLGINDMTRHQVEIDGAFITYIGTRNFLVSHIVKDTVRIKVLSRHNSKLRMVASAKFKVQEAGKPSVVLDERYDDTLSNGQIWNGTSLEVKLPNGNYDGNYRVAHFEISLSDSAGKVIMPPTFTSGKYLSKAVYDKITSLPRGGLIHFTQVILTYADGVYKKHSDFRLRKS